MGIWDCVSIGWNYFAKVLSPLGMILLIMVIWAEVKAYLTRKRVGLILDKKDEYIQILTEKSLTAVEGYVKLTGLLERIVEGIGK